MLVVVTGISGVGKSSIMKNNKVGIKQIFLDEWVKKNLYLKWQKGYRLIKKHFGKEYINTWNVARYDLGKLVFNDPKQLKKLNDLINPLIRKFLMRLNNTNKNYIIEQATYMAHENDFKQYYNGVILIERPSKDNNSIYKSIKKTNIKYDILIKNNKNLEDVKYIYKKAIKKLFNQ